MQTEMVTIVGVHWQIMTTKQRTDLQMNIPALRKLDAMLIVSSRIVCLMLLFLDSEAISLVDQNER